MNRLKPGIVGVILAAGLLANAPVYAQPYPDSSAITDITFDGATHQFGAIGTDNFPITWADDDKQYTSGGDGNGFAGGERSSLIVSSIDGGKSAYQATDVWESSLSGQGPADGKSYGIISVGGILYMWVSPGSDTDGYLYSKVWKSVDKGQSWEDPGWQFSGYDASGGNHGFINPTFLQFGRDYQGARDGFVYIYANELKLTAALQVQTPGEVALMRVPMAQITERNAYEFYAGLDSNQAPIWSADIETRQPVFLDNNGVGWNSSVSYNAPLDRYFLITEHSETVASHIGIFDAPTPWGPWTTVLYEQWSVPGTGGQNHFFWNFSNKWLSADGKRFVIVSTGIGDQDRWNTVEGDFITDASAPKRPNPPGDFDTQ